MNSSISLVNCLVNVDWPNSAVLAVVFTTGVVANIKAPASVAIFEKPIVAVERLESNAANVGDVDASVARLDLPPRSAVPWRAVRHWNGGDFSEHVNQHHDDGQ